MEMSRIAIIDDDTRICETLREKLASSGHECVVVNEGGEAFKALKQARPDLVVLDLMMPEVSAFRLCRMIRRDPLLYTVAVMVMASAEDEPEILHCMEQGADDYLVRPIAPMDVLRKVQALLLLRDATAKRDPLTGMPGTLAVKREINHKLARGATIAACYIGATNGKALTGDGRAVGSGADDLVQDVAGLISKLADELEIYEVFAGYVGAAHFVVVLNLEGYKKFCKRLIENFSRGIVQGNRSAAFPHPSATPVTQKVAVGVAHNQYRTFRSADKMFRVLAEVHRKAQESATSSYFVDRRRLDR